jgi:DNA-binding NtrC family response regulator/serine/threonine protein kinase/tetratricopeptide (TPR) repeat protein
MLEPVSPAHEAMLELGGRYRYLRELGRGGVGRVVLVHDSFLDRELALKILEPPDDFGLDLEGFEREFRLLSHLEHPRIARSFDFGWIDRRPFFTTEYVPGEALSARADWSDGIPDLIRISTEIAEALAFLHEHGIVHLDVKPSNILRFDSLGRQSAKLIDFGLCRRGFDRQHSGPLRGTLPYMAPEFAQGGEIGPWTDVYSLGITFYRLACGHYPRPGASLLFEEDPGASRDRLAREFDEAVRRSWLALPKPLSEWNERVPRAWSLCILRAIALDPSQRFRNAREFLDAIESRSAPASRSPAPVPSRARATHGRDDVLRELSRFFTGSNVASQRRLLAVTGPPGSGMSHLLREAKTTAQTLGQQAFLEIGYPALAPRAGMLFRSLEIPLRHDAAAEADRWKAFLDRLERPRRSLRSETTERERRFRRSEELSAVARELREPFVLIVDGLQHFDEISIALISDLARFLADSESDERPPISLVIGYREEGPHAALLGEITELASRAGLESIITLGPLDVRDTMALYIEMRGDRFDEGARDVQSSSPLEIHQRSGGLPRSIASLALGVDSNSATGAPSGIHRTRASAAEILDSEDPTLILALELFERPVHVRELAGTFGSSSRVLAARLARLERASWVERSTNDAAESLWRPAIHGASVTKNISAASRKKVRTAIAQELLRASKRTASSALVEAVRHFLAAGRNREATEHGLVAARYLQGTFQNRAALELLDALLERIPTRRHALRHETILEKIDVLARLGNLEEGLRLLRERLVPSNARHLNPADRLELRFRLASLHTRRGDFQRADRLFAEAFAALPRERRQKEPRLGRITKAAYLVFLNEHAALKAIIGDTAQCLEICENGLRMAGRDRSFRVREAALNFWATRANVHLRRFDSKSAIENYERALELAESIGSDLNRAVILNNLGIVYMQIERSEEATRLFRDAEELCRRLDEGPSLVSIACNLAVLEARRGEALRAAESIGRAEALRTREMGQRQELFLAHTAGLVALYRGRYADALRRFDRALEISASMKDSHLLAFDRVYRGECLTWLASYGDAERELTGLSGDESAHPRARSMAEARLACLLATTGRHERALELARSVTTDDPPLATFLDATDALHAGRALSISGDIGAADRALERAERYFEDRAYRPFANQATWARAENAFLGGDESSALEIARRASDTASDALAGLVPLLTARLLLSSVSRDAVRTAGDLLARAGAAFAMNSLPEWELRTEAIRLRLDERRGRRGGEFDTVRARERIANSLDPAERKAYADSRHWTRWVQDWSPPTEVGAGDDADGIETEVEASPKTESPPAEELTALLATRTTSVTRASLVARSKSMRRLVERLDRVSALEIPILITGETGVGKEYIARIVHAESPRGAQPFRIVDCLTMPSGVIEAELFGSVSGSFTDSGADRSGLLRAASGGTAFIDDVADLPLEVQAKLLRVISNGVVRPIGAEKEVDVDIRFIFGTAKDLTIEVREGRFRADLFHRIHVLPLSVPPLRERIEDITDLADIFLAEIDSERESSSPTRDPEVHRRRLDPMAIRALESRRWGGNVRELRNALLRISVERSGVIGHEDIGRLDDRTRTSILFPHHLLRSERLPELQQRLEREYLLFHLRRVEGDLNALETFLGSSRRQLYRRCERLGISLRAFRRDLSARKRRSD